MNEPKVLIRQEDKILRITFNRPEKKNALDYEMYQALTDGLNLAAANNEIVAVIFDSNGDSFTAGNDLKDFLTSTDILNDSPALQFLRVLANFPKVIIAGVHGAAVGIGTTLLLHCDLIIAATNTRFQLPFVNLGLVPEAASSLLLPARLGHVQAAELLLLGEPFDAKTAMHLGLINRVVEYADLDAAINEMAGRLKNKPSYALLETKKLLKSKSVDVETRMNEEFASFSRCLGNAEFKAAAEQFFKMKSA